jgi:hypothetical protein
VVEQDGAELGQRTQEVGGGVRVDLARVWVRVRVRVSG